MRNKNSMKFTFPVVASALRADRQYRPSSNSGNEDEGGGNGRGEGGELSREGSQSRKVSVEKTERAESRIFKRTFIEKISSLFEVK